MAAKTKVDFSVPGMSCENCANKIKATLADVDGVGEVTPKFPEKHVSIRFDASKVSEAQLANALGKAGFATARVG